MPEALSIHSFEPTAPEALAAFLRRATADAHSRLESALDLLGPPPTRERFIHLLGRFHGFHIEWEAALHRRPSMAFLGPRRRTPNLVRDLTALGLGEADLERLPRCAAAGALAQTDEAALGSAYVMEGSTLGGQLIGRALAGAAWLPPSGLTYFPPYGAATGEMWRSFRAWADAHAASRRRDQVAAGANRTFETLQAWLTV